MVIKQKEVGKTGKRRINKVGESCAAGRMREDWRAEESRQSREVVGG